MRAFMLRIWPLSIFHLAAHLYPWTKIDIKIDIMNGDYRSYLMYRMSEYDESLKTIFYTTLLEHQSECTIAILTKIDNDLNATKDLSPEVKQRWLPLGLSLKYWPAYVPAYRFVSEQRRL